MEAPLLTATTANEPTPTRKNTHAIEKRRPPLVKSVPFIRPRSGNSSEMFSHSCMKSRATYRGCVRLRMFNLEMTCLCGPRGHRPARSRQLLADEQDADARARRGAQPVSFPSTSTSSPSTGCSEKRISNSSCTASLESKRREDIQSRLAEHTARWRAGNEMEDVLHESLPGSNGRRPVGSPERRALFRSARGI